MVPSALTEAVPLTGCVWMVGVVTFVNVADEPFPAKSLVRTAITLGDPLLEIDTTSGLEVGVGVAGMVIITSAVAQTLGVATVQI